MNNLLSYCGLVDAKIRASDKDLPVNHTIRHNQKKLKDGLIFFSEARGLFSYPMLSPKALNICQILMRWTHLNQRSEMKSEIYIFFS